LLQTLSELLEGILFIAIMRLAPGGIWPLACRLARRVLRRAGQAAAPGPDLDRELEPAGQRISPADLT
jgi:branched-chain amino acid transport system permease protein